MRFALMLEPQQGLTYQEQLDLARLAERLGFEAMFRSDHYRSFAAPPDAGATDAWTVLAGLARETKRIRLGVLVSPATFRHPGSFAKVVTTVDEMSGGRIEVGVGAGWNEPEHSQLGLPFPEIGQRVDLLEDELALLHGVWEEPDGWSFEGKRLTVRQAQFHPKPVQHPHPPIIVGGGGSPRSLRLAARYADEYNATGPDLEQSRDIFVRLDAECRVIGRDPATLTRSAMVGLLLGADQAEVLSRMKVQLETTGRGGTDPAAWLEQRKDSWIAGTPDQARASVARFAAAGVQRLMLQDLIPRDHAMIELAARELLGRS